MGEKSANTRRMVEANHEYERQAIIRNSLGMHVRPATKLAEKARQFSSEVSLIKDGTVVNAKSCIELLTLAAVEGTALTIRARGEDAREAVEAVHRLIDSGFGEI